MVLGLLAGVSFGAEIGAELGSALPVGGLEYYGGAGLSGTVYGTVGDKFNLTVEAGYNALTGKFQGYGFSFTDISCDLGYRFLSRSNSSLDAVAGVGVVFLDRTIGVNTEHGTALGISFGSRFEQRSGRVRTRLELLPMLVTDGKGWAAVVGFRVGVGYAI